MPLLLYTCCLVEAAERCVFVLISHTAYCYTYVVFEPVKRYMFALTPHAATTYMLFLEQISAAPAVAAIYMSVFVPLY